MPALVASLFLLVCVSPTALAAIAVPADAPVVAGPTPSGTSAIAFVRGAQICMAFRRHGEPQPKTLEGIGSCVATPVLGPFQHTLVAERPGGHGDPHQKIGIASSATARVQFRLGAKVVATTDTTPSPFPGAAAGLRFYALEAGEHALSDELALLDATDMVRRAYPPESNGVFDGGGPPAPVDGRGRILAQGRRGGVRWQLRTRIDHPLAGTPLLPERRVATPCIVFGSSLGGDEVCDEDNRAAEPMLVAGRAVCAPIGAFVAVLARAAVRRVVVVLGDGHRRTLSLQAVPGAQAGLRAGLVVAGTGLAVRHVIALDAHGRTLTRQKLAIPPVFRTPNCGLGLGGALLRYSAGLSTKLLGTGPHMAQVATDGARLCLAIDRAPRPPAGCALPPLDANEVLLHAQPTVDGRYVAGFVPPEVVAARLVLDDGSTREVAPVAITGPYAEHVRLLAADVPGPHRVIGYDLLNAAGLALAHIDYAPEQRRLAHQTVLARDLGHGLSPITAGQIPANHGIGPATCVGMKTLGPAPCVLVEPGYFEVVASCEPRQLVIVGALHRANQRVAVRTSSGREIAARIVPLPAALRRNGAGLTSLAAVAVAVVPANDAPRRVIVRGPASGNALLSLPPAREQCGYRTFAAPGDRFG